MSLEEFRFDEKDHSYWLGDKRLTGVTSIIGVLAKPALIGWAARMACEYLQENTPRKEVDGIPYWLVQLHDLEQAKSAHAKKKEAAGTHGTDAHALVEKYVKYCLDEWGGKPTLPEWMGLDSPIAQFFIWSQENVDHFLFSERRMFSRELHIAGTADFAYVGKDGKRYMADFKTSSGIYGIDYWLQVAAYRLLAEAEGDTPYDGATVVRLGKNGEFEVQQRFDYTTDKEAFLACLTLYRAQATYIKPK